MILAVTGHRPDKLGGYSPAAFDGLVILAVEQLDILKPSRVLTGMALGWDLAVAQACIGIGVPFAAYVPCDDQSKPWPRPSREHYDRVLNRAVEIVNVSPGSYAAWKMLRRDEVLVLDCDKLLALYNGLGKGGTAATVMYAERHGKPVVNCWPEFVRISK